MPRWHLRSPGARTTPATSRISFPAATSQQEHAKPGGHGYFKNFDPKACKLEVYSRPAGSPRRSARRSCSSRTVFDKDGQPRRSRRVEWMIDGPGNIVEADESGLYPGRGYKVDNKYAVSYTSYTTKTITRGNDDPGDDVIIEPGQTFCVLSSAVPGETVVTAYAPEVFNWDQGRVVVKDLLGRRPVQLPRARGRPLRRRTHAHHDRDRRPARRRAERLPHPLQGARRPAGGARLPRRQRHESLRTRCQGSRGDHRRQRRSGRAARAAGPEGRARRASRSRS